MTSSKQERATRVADHILTLDKEFGTTVPARHNKARLSRLVSVKGHWDATISPGYRLAFATVYEERVGEHRIKYGSRWIPDEEWAVIELAAKNRKVLVLSVRGGEVELFSFRPGDWEAWFGVQDENDRTVFEAVFFPRPGSAELEELMRRPDFQLPPLRRGPMLDIRPAEVGSRKRSRRSQYPGSTAKFPSL